ncbi:Hypothetical predicted protein, partial [Pelobates cultripes]
AKSHKGLASPASPTRTEDEPHPTTVTGSDTGRTRVGGAKMPALTQTWGWGGTRPWNKAISGRSAKKHSPRDTGHRHLNTNCTHLVIDNLCT